MEPREIKDRERERGKKKRRDARFRRAASVPSDISVCFSRAVQRRKYVDIRGIVRGYMYSVRRVRSRRGYAVAIISPRSSEWSPRA